MTRTEPVFFHHGTFVDSDGAIVPGLEGKPWLFSLFDANYDVWFGSYIGDECEDLNRDAR